MPNFQHQLQVALDSSHTEHVSHSQIILQVHHIN